MATGVQNESSLSGVAGVDDGGHAAILQTLTGHKQELEVDKLFRALVKFEGSDLHLKVGRPPTVRVAGELVQLEQAPLKPEDLKALAEKLMTPRQVKEFAEHKESDFAIGVPGGSYTAEFEPPKS